jgi:Epoxide hydrolase N terminus
VNAAEPFEIAIPQGEIHDLHERLRRARWTDDFENDAWGYGVPGTYLRELVGYWLDGFDWRAQEAAINEFDNFRADVDGIPIHFIHERGHGKQVVPLVLTHGWPWTFWDYANVIRPPADPAAFGAPADLAFDVVVPSLPGYGFSIPLRRPIIEQEICDSGSP